MNKTEFIVGTALAGKGATVINRIDKVNTGFAGTERKAFVMIANDLTAPVILGFWCPSPTPKYYAMTQPAINIEECTIGAIVDRDLMPKKTT
jgi:hypothetical protein